jgi:hypothetical protein
MCEQENDIKILLEKEKISEKKIQALNKGIKSTSDIKK